MLLVCRPTQWRGEGTGSLSQQVPSLGVQHDLINITHRNATVTELFVEAKSSGQLDLVETGSGNLRLVEIISNKIFCISRPEQTLESLQVTRLVNLCITQI